jgi:EmrB/QacA subfamily drug resistance transporter
VTRRRRLLVLAICCTSLLMVSLDLTIVNVALPAIRRDLHTSVAGLQWTLDAYALVLASLLILAGATADRVGRRRVFQLGLVLFGLGSLLCSLAPNLGSLIGFRIVQAVGGSMLNPVALSIITNTFTQPRERAQAIGVWGATAGLSMALGPTVGGVLVDSIGWRAVFWVNVPVVAAGVALTALFVPDSRASRPRRLDPVGQLLVLAALATLLYAIIEGPGAGWAAPRITGCFVAAALAVAGLVVYELRHPEPLLQLRFFRSLPMSGAALMAISSTGALTGFLLLNTLYLQEVRGLSAVRAGLYMLPMAVLAAAIPPVAGRVVGSRGSRIPLLVSGIAITGSGLLLTQLRTTGPDALLVIAYLLFGIGLGSVNPPITNAAVAGMPRAQAGVAAAIASTSRQVGASLGVAVIGSVVTAGIHASLPEEFAAASHTAWWIITGCGVAIGALGLITTSAHARRTAAAAVTPAGRRVATGPAGDRPATAAAATQQG